MAGSCRARATVGSRGTESPVSFRIVLPEPPPAVDEPPEHTPADQQQATEQIATEDLYPAPEAISPDLATALRLLGKASSRIQAAMLLLQGGDQVGADLETGHLHALLPQLFACRKLGEGFATLANGLLCCISNLNGAPLNISQIRAVARVVELLRREPFVSFDIACDHIDSLESAGLTVEPAGYGHLIDWLYGQSPS